PATSSAYATFAPTTALYPISLVCFHCPGAPRALHSFPTRRSSDLTGSAPDSPNAGSPSTSPNRPSSGSRSRATTPPTGRARCARSEEHTSELQSRSDLVCRLLLEKKKKKNKRDQHNTGTRPRTLHQ